jgi:DNA repair exonuclease SbcCD ATPase subunit
MNIVKHILFLAILSFIVISCKESKEEEKNPLADSLMNVNSELSGKLNEKEVALMEFIESFNEIQENLNAIKEKEKIITKNTSGENVSKKEQIKEDIQTIYDLMQKNKARINALSEKLKNSNLKIEGLQKMIANLEKTIQEKDNEIEQLKSKLEAMHIEITNLTANLNEIQKENQEKEEKLKTAYYVIGTEKELKEKNIISKTGGFIGIGKSTTVKSDFNKEYFTEIRIDNVNEITIGGKKCKIVTTHPSSSYEMVMNGKVAEKLVIKNAQDFWSVSKYLVIIIQ